MMTTSPYKLAATIPSLKHSTVFSLHEGRRYLLGSAEMEPGMLVFSQDRSLSRRQAWLEIINDNLHVERHPKASQKLNGDDSIQSLKLEIGEYFSAGMTVFRFLKQEKENIEPAPDVTFAYATTTASLALGKREIEQFIKVVGQIPRLMSAHDAPSAFLLALCKTLKTSIAGLNVSAWSIEQQDDLLDLVPLCSSEQEAELLTQSKPSLHLIEKALTLAGDECAVSVWHSGAGMGGAWPSMLSLGANWAMCIAIPLSEHERFALHATGEQHMRGDQLNEVQRIFAALGAIAKQHLLAARAKERQGQIGQFFSPALRSILFGDLSKAAQILHPTEQEAAILFFDLRGSSRLAEDMDINAGENKAVKHLAFLERILGDAASVIFETGGMVIDFQGDAILACWGIPQQASPKDPKWQALLAARQIVELMAEHDWPGVLTESGSSLRCGIGITCGRVLAGLFNAQGRDQTRLSKYTVVGRAVNQAARLEAMTKRFGVPILIDDAIASALSGKELLLRRIAKVRPAGMQDVIAIHELVLPRQFGGTGIDETGVNSYAAALALYEIGDLEAAAAMIAGMPNDPIAKFLHEQIVQSLGKPVPNDWSGVITLWGK